jgi:SAM-dependent methyltransferase
VSEGAEASYLEAYLSARRERVLHGVDLSRRGLEMGPHDRPLVSKADFPVEYVDYTDTETLRAQAYVGADAAAIPAVDHVWASRPLIELVGEPVGYVVASHVAEHVPDLAGWLLEMHQVLAPDGVLSLVLPDRRFTFDRLRPPSTLGDVVEAYLTKRRTPSIRHVFDNCALGVSVDHGQAWREPLDDRALPRLVGEGALQFAWDQCAEIAETPRYIDSHCWIFTPESFLDLLEGMARLRLAPFRVRSFTPTQRDDLEFFVQLTPEAPDALPEILGSIELARARLADADQPLAASAPAADDEPRARRRWFGLRR